MKFRKFLSVILAIIICISTATVFAFAEDDSEGEMPTLPPTEDIEVAILYAPPTSRVIYDKAGPFIDGMILKIVARKHRFNCFLAGMTKIYGEF